ncbi:peptidyl-prolyl cis-trans isomerase FKBP4-like [Halichondria panicea]|uniref:peptidyl-prolyl cis-trans isomerase FKBP4-like n=1 Tax=Halichondria panicea TaxID=6063 RepID=UPI00312B99CB
MADEKQEEMPPADTANPDWGDDITPSKDGGLFKSILTAGHGVEHPLHGDEVSVHYTGRLLTGEVFDSSVERGELFKFKLGQNQVIKGWDVGVATMVKGEKCILTCKPDYAYGSTGSLPKIPPDATLQFEVELFDWYGEDLTGDGGIVKSIVSKGDGYSKPTDGAQVEAHIRGSYKGRVIEERDISFEYGEGSEIKLLSGVEKAIGSMQTNEVAQVVIKGKYITEKFSNQEIIPDDAEIMYEIRLNKFTKPKESWEYGSVEERVTDATALKERGTKYFKDSKYDLALKLYTRGMALVEDSAIPKDKLTEEACSVRVSLHLNLAIVYLKRKEDTLTIKECTDALADDDQNIKAYFRMGQALFNLQNYEEAVASFQQVLKIESGNKAAVKQLEMCRSKQRSQREKEKKLYSNMFRKLAQEDESVDTGSEPAVKPGEGTSEEGTSVNGTSVEGTVEA